MENLTKYRTELMGLGMIWIIIFHSSITFPEFLYPLQFLKEIGYAGVEIFFLLSGIGLAFSYSKDKNVGRFFKKRFLRIIPTFWLCVLVVQLIEALLGNEFILKKFLLAITGMNYLIFKDTGNWFIPAIIVCYIFFPVYWYVSEKLGHLITLVISSILILIFTYLIRYTSYYYLLVFAVRIPIFLLGVYIGYGIFNKKKFSAFFTNKWFLLILFAGALGLLIWVKVNMTYEDRVLSAMAFYPTILMAFPLIIFLGYLLDKIPGKHRLSNTLGVYSLELYLTHGIIFLIADRLLLKDMGVNFYRIPEFIVVVILAMLFSVLIKIIVNWIMKGIDYLTPKTT